MQSNLERLNEFDINYTDLTKFCEVLEHLELSYQLEKKLGKSKKLEMSKKDVDKPNGKQSGKKCANTTNESSPVSAKKPCLLHGTHSHMTDKCKVMKEQAQQMKAMYDMQNLVEHAKKCKQMKANKAPTHDKINEMVAESVKKSVKEMFETHVKTLKSAAMRIPIPIVIVSQNMSISYHMEDVGLDLKEVNVSETFALSDLRRPPQKCQKTNQLTPVTVALINSWLEKSRFKKIRILLDSGSSGSIILEKIVHKLCMQNDTTASWITKGENFQTSKKCKITFILKEFFENKSIEWNLYVDSTPGPHQYDILLGHNIMSKLRITLDFKDQTMTWDNSTINMKDPESLPDLLDPVNDFFWSNNLYETEALQEATSPWKISFQRRSHSKAATPCLAIPRELVLPMGKLQAIPVVFASKQVDEPKVGLIIGVHGKVIKLL